jgi:hypothetical protein
LGEKSLLGRNMLPTHGRKMAKDVDLTQEIEDIEVKSILRISCARSLENLIHFNSYWHVIPEWDTSNFKFDSFKCHRFALDTWSLNFPNIQRPMHGEKEREATTAIFKRPRQHGELKRLQWKLKACGKDRRTCAEAWWQSKSCRSQSPKTL